MMSLSPTVESYHKMQIEEYFNVSFSIFLVSRYLFRNRRMLWVSQHHAE